MAFPQDIHSFTTMQDVQASDMINVAKYKDLIKKGATRTPAEDLELNNLKATLDNKNFNADKINAIYNAIIELETFFRDNTVGYIETKQTEFQAEIDKFSDQGVYNPTTTYFKKNFVFYNDGSGDKTYLCINDAGTGIVGIDPTNPVNWKLMTITGQKGADGIGVGLTFRGKFDAGTSYSKDDGVQFGGDMFASLIDNNIGNQPDPLNDTPFWAKALDVSITVSELKGTRVMVSNTTNVDFITGEITAFNPTVDSLSVFQNTIKLTEGIHYEINNNNQSIDKKSGSWSGTVAIPIIFEFVVIKNIVNDLVFSDGSSIENGTVTEDKLNITVQNKLSQIELNKNDIIPLTNLPSKISILEMENLRLKMQLEEAELIDFVNKSGIGFYDLFDTEDNVDAGNTTATVNTTDKRVEFLGQQVLKMNQETFDTFDDIDLRLYMEKTNEAKVKGDVTNSSSVDVANPTDRNLIIGDKLYINNAENEILDIVVNAVNADHTTPIQIVDQSYNTGNNAGRKLIQLTNDTFACGLWDTTNSRLKYYKTVDSGATWVKLTFDDSFTGGDYALQKVTDNTFVVARSANDTTLTYTLMDADTGSRITFGDVDSGQSSLQDANVSISMAINSSETEIHACWSCKNGLDVENFNIRYSKVVINGDGSLTWGAVEQVTTSASGSITQYDGGVNPSITLDENDVPMIAIASRVSWRNDGSWMYLNYHGIMILRRDLSLSASRQFIHANWSAMSVYEPSRTQKEPCTVFVPTRVNGLANGRLWLVWDGKDDVDTVTYNIKVSYSDDKGQTWSTMEKLATGITGTYDSSLTVNSDGNPVAVCWDGNADIQKFAYNGTIWSSETLISDVGSNTSPSTLFDHTFKFSFTKPLCIWQDTGTPRVAFYGSWSETVAYTLTLTNPVTLTDNEKVAIVDFFVEQGVEPMTLKSIDTEKYEFDVAGLATASADIKVTGKDNNLNNIVYAIN